MAKGFSSVLMRDDGGDPGGGGVLGVDGVPGVPLVSEPFLTRDLGTSGKQEICFGSDSGLKEKDSMRFSLSSFMLSFA